MTPEELYGIWAPEDSRWSPWVLPVPFAQLVCPDSIPIPTSPRFDLRWISSSDARNTAIVADLPGGDAIHYGLALTALGYRPVPVIDGSPGPESHVVSPLHSSFSALQRHKPRSTVDMRGLLDAICSGAKLLRERQLEADAPPAFLLDSMRMAAVAAGDPEIFDNRWRVFPQDFPSARFLLKAGIRKVILVHDKSLREPQEDLAHVLLRWQEGGISIESQFAHAVEAPVPIKVRRPFRFRRLWYRALAVLGLRRNDAGGFGGYPPEISGGG
jgi:hypothetical protein